MNTFKKTLDGIDPRIPYPVVGGPWSGKIYAHHSGASHFTIQELHGAAIKMHRYWLDALPGNPVVWRYGGEVA